MNKFIKNIGCAIAIACGCGVLVGGDYCAYASQIEEHDPGQYDDAFLDAVKQVFVIDENGRPLRKREDGKFGGMGAGNILWFLDTSKDQIIMLYSKKQTQNAEKLASFIRKRTKKNVVVYSADNAVALINVNRELFKLELLQNAAKELLNYKSVDSSYRFQNTLFYKAGYKCFLKNDMSIDEINNAVSDNVKANSEKYEVTFLKYLLHTEPIFVLLVAKQIFRPNRDVGVYSILNPCKSCQWLFDQTTKLNCDNCFAAVQGSDRIVFHYCAIDSQHQKTDLNNTWSGWYVWQNVYNNAIEPITME